MVVEINNWCTIISTIGPPQKEVKVIQVHGAVNNHPHHKPGDIVTTSVVKTTRGRYFKTQNTIYKLKDPHPDWLNWMKVVGRKVNLLEPLADLITETGIVISSLRKNTYGMNQM